MRGSVVIRSVFGFIGLFILLQTQVSLGCTKETIDNITDSIRASQSDAAAQFKMSLSTLQLCEENLYHVGWALADSIQVSQNSTQGISEVIVQNAESLPSELSLGLAMGLIDGIQLYQQNSYYMLRAIAHIGDAHPELTKQLALELLKNQSPSAPMNETLLKVVEIFQKLAASGKTSATPTTGSYWSFRSRNESCGIETGPWGDYEMCPRFMSSVSDQFGNRVILTCKAGNDGISMRVSLGQDAWSRVRNQQIETFGFGADGKLQAFGVPYVVGRDHSLLAEETLAPEILDQLAGGRSLNLSVRLNAGEGRLDLKFNLQGSNKAIQELRRVCR